jgi:biopolymer transport protein ExbB/TolQ
MQPHSSSALQERLLEVFLYLGSEWILWILLALSVLSIAIAIERLIHFARATENVDQLRADVDAKINSGGLAELRSDLAARRSHVAHVLVRGIDALERGPAAVEEVLTGATQLERLKMERGLAFLGTLGNNAPYIGLFGTVLGIIRAFRDLSTNTIEGSAAVMAGIAEALVATAVGLLVALPAVAVYNAFQRKIRTQLVTAEAIARSLIAHAKSRKNAA